MSEAVSRLPRAAILPLQALGALTGIHDVLGASAYSLSFHEAGPTHLLVVADALPASFAASVSLAGGRILYGRSDSRCFAEASEEFPAPWDQGLTIRLRGFAEAMAVGGSPKPLSAFLEVRWSPEARPFARPDFPGVPVRLRPESAPKPALALVVPLRDRIGVEDALYSFPESRLEGVSFATGEEEIILVSTNPGTLEGLPGDAFHELPQGSQKRILLPLGFALEPEFAPAWLSDLLGKGGDLFFWRESGIQSVWSSELKPLTRRSWFEVFHGDR